MKRGGQKILIVENDAVQALDLEGKLKKWGYSVLETAATAAEAVECAKTHAPHLVVMDIMLSESKDGLYAARAIRNNGGHMPIIFLTAFDKFATPASKIGFFSFLNKDVGDDILRQTVKVAIEHFNYMQEVADARSVGEARVLEEEYIRKLISAKVFAILRKRPTSLQPKHANVAVGFVDIRGFTKLSNTIQIEQMNKVLELYFTSVCRAVTEHNGFVDKFIGDAVMWFHHGKEPEYICEAIIAVACDILYGLKSLNGQIKEKCHTAIKLNLGIGLAYGQCAVGIFGAPEHRIQYSVIGPPVNMAARMCSLAGENEICIGDRIIDHCKLTMNRVGFKAVKGFEYRVEVRKVVLPKESKRVVGESEVIASKSFKGDMKLKPRSNNKKDASVKRK